MKKLYFDTLILALLVMVGLPTDLRAQASSTLKFSDVATVAAATDKDHESEDGCVYLYNVGSGEYLSVGGSWGTQPMTHEVGMALYINRGTNDELSGVSVTTTDDDGNSTTTAGVYYQIGSNVNASYSYVTDGYIGYVRSGFGGSVGLYVDRDGTNKQQLDGIVRMIFTEVTSTDSNGPIYNISFRDYAASGTNYTHDNNGDWASGVSSSTAYTTYYMVAQEGDNQVIKAVPSDSVNTSEGLAQWRIVTRGNFIDDFKNVNDGTEKANATFLVTDQNFNRNNKYQSKWTTSTSVTIGCGSGNQETYGAYWLATITGAGSVTQEIESVASGWYQLIIKGFSTETSAAQISISYTSDGSTTTHTADLNIFTNTEAYSDFTSQATIKDLDSVLIAANSEYQTSSSVMLFVPEGATFTIGVTADENSGYTMFDDVQLYFCGQNEEMILDEGWDKDVLKYINWQVTTYTKTLFLKRSLVANQWNSLILPVDITLENLQSAFGSGTQLCKLTGVSDDGGQIYFKSVLSDGSSTALEANKMYIIKPTSLNQQTSDHGYSIKNNNATNDTSTETTYTGTLKAPYFTITGVSFTSGITSTDGTITDTEITSARDGKIYMMGTYVANTTVPDKSYVINANDGNWYYLNMGSSSITSQGFRAWISTKDVETTSMASMATLHIDEESVTDGIDGLAEELGIETPGGVYSLSGQKVSSGSLSGLPKGIYIKNGKKYIVK